MNETNTDIVERSPCDESKEDPLEKVYITVNRKGRVFSDRLLMTNNYLLTSNRLLQLLNDSKCQEFQTVPVVVDLGKKRIGGECTLILPRQEIDILDLTRSEVKFFKSLILSVNKWVAAQNKLPNLDLFYLIPSFWVVSEKLKTEVAKLKYTGCRFDLIEVVKS